MVHEALSVADPGARRRLTAGLYLLGSLAYVPGALLLHPAVNVGREYEAVAFYIAGSAAMTLAAALDYSGSGIDSVHLCGGGGVCFLAGSIAIWPGNRPSGAVVGLGISHWQPGLPYLNLHELARRPVPPAPGDLSLRALGGRLLGGRAPKRARPGP